MASCSQDIQYKLTITHLVSTATRGLDLIAYRRAAPGYVGRGLDACDNGDLNHAIHFAAQ